MTLAVTDASGTAVAECAVRVACVLCGGAPLLPLESVPSVPTHMGCVSDGIRSDCFARQCWAQCPSCGAPQLEFLVPLGLVYRGQHNAALGAVWQRHHDAFLTFLAAGGAGCAVVEVGGANGTLGQRAMATGTFDEWTIIEPNPEVKPAGIRIVEGFVEDESDVVRGADLIVHSHVLEHLYDPWLTLSAIRAAISRTSDMVFSVPNIPSLLSLNGANALNFEHTYYFDEASLAWLLSRAGFAVERMQYFEGHSIFIHARPASTAPVSGACPSGSGGARQLREFLAEGYRDARSLRARVDREADRSVFLFGAHVFSQFLLSAGLGESGISGVLDNDPAKQGKRLYGTGLQVLAPADIADVDDCAVIVRAAHYTDEIVTQLKSIRTEIKIW